MLRRKVQSFRYALNGLAIAWREEMNFRIQVVLGALVIALGYSIGLSLDEFAIIFLLIGFVLATEALNTALEEFCDMVKSDQDPHIAKIKDLAAAAPLIASITALVVGGYVFLPHLTALV